MPKLQVQQTHKFHRQFHPQLQLQQLRNPHLQVDASFCQPSDILVPAVVTPKAPKKSKYEKDPDAPPKPWVDKPKKKVKRKNKPAKNPDPSNVADPERWKPKYERAGYKPRRVKGR